MPTSRSLRARQALVSILVLAASIAIAWPVDAQMCQTFTAEQCASAQNAPSGVGDSAGTIRLPCGDSRSLPDNTPLRIFFDASGLSGNWTYEVYRFGSGQPVRSGTVATTQADIGMLPVGDYSFRVAILNDCGDPVCGFSTSCTFSVLQPVPMILRFSASPASIVAGQSSTLTWMTSGARDAFLHPLGAVSANGSIVVTPAVTTTYRLVISGDVEATTTVQVSADSCSIAPTTPIISFAYAGSTASCSSSSNSPACAAGESITFTAAGNGYTFAECDTVTWDFGDGETSQGTSVSHRFASPGLYRVRMTVANRSGQATVEQTIAVPVAKRRAVRK